MSPDGPVLATLLGMAAVTCATRLLGFALAVRLPLGGGLRAFLERIPGATFAALAAPLVVAGGPPEWLAAAASAAILRASGQVFAAIAGYVAVVAACRGLVPLVP